MRLFFTVCAAVILKKFKFLYKNILFQCNYWYKGASIFLQKYSFNRAA